MVKAVLETETFGGAKSAAQNVRDILRIGNDDIMSLVCMLPAMYLRLGRDQASYDLVKMWDLAPSVPIDDEDEELDWSYLDVVKADVFESPRCLRDGSLLLGQQVEVALLKIRLLMDLMALRNANYVALKLPQELFDRVKFFIASTDVIRNSPGILSGTKYNYSDLILELPCQIDELYDAVDKTNTYFWDCLLEPGEHLIAPPHRHHGSINGTIKEAQLKLQYCYDSWVETPGSIDFIKTISARKKKNCRD
ncbi:MAG: hypothetical protein Q9221_001077 [Calogaya cf. arnoldii]